MYLVANSGNGGINIGSMRIFNNSSDIHYYLANYNKREVYYSKWGLRVYYFESPGHKGKRVTEQFKDSLK